MTCGAALAWRSKPPILFIATVEPNLCPMDTPQSLDWITGGSPGSLHTISWKDWEKVAGVWCWWVGLLLEAPYSPRGPHASALLGITINYRCH